MGGCAWLTVLVTTMRTSSGRQNSSCGIWLNTACVTQMKTALAPPSRTSWLTAFCRVKQVSARSSIRITCSAEWDQ